MKLIIGGAFQGKKTFAKTLCPDIEFIDGQICDPEAIFTCKGIYHFHEYIRNVKEEQRAVLADKLIHQNPEIVLVSDEIGYGLVPIDAADRCYREQVGRICTELAAFSDEVVRVVMGIGTKIKG